MSRSLVDCRRRRWGLVMAKWLLYSLILTFHGFTFFFIGSVSSALKLVYSPVAFSPLCWAYTGFATRKHCTLLRCQTWSVVRDCFLREIATSLPRKSAHNATNTASSLLAVYPERRNTCGKMRWAWVTFSSLCKSPPRRICCCWNARRSCEMSVVFIQF